MIRLNGFKTFFFFDQLKQTLIILLNTSKLIRHIIRFGLYINVES
jgi:hypothetical protein